MPATKPEEGHNTSRITLGVSRVREQTRSMLSLRPAYHSLEDSQNGYLDGAAIELLRTDLSLQLNNSADAEPRVQEFNLLKVYSLSPRTAFLQPLSWKMDFTARREFNHKQKEALNPTGTLGFGRTYSLSETIQSYALLNAVVEYAENDWNALIGPEIGMTFSISEVWRIHASSQTYLSESQTSKRNKVITSYALSKNQALLLDIDHSERYQRSTMSMGLAWALYF